MTSIDGGVECSVCGYRVQTLTGAAAMTRIYGVNRETATLDREIR